MIIGAHTKMPVFHIGHEFRRPRFAEYAVGVRTSSAFGHLTDIRLILRLDNMSPTHFGLSGPHLANKKTARDPRETASCQES